MADAVRSYAAWWHEAGLHTAIDSVAHGWRGEQPVPFWRQAAQRPPVETRPVAPADGVATVPMAAPRAPTRPDAMPDQLPAFLDWLAQDDGQPETGWEGAIILPPAQQGGRLTLIVEMPTLGATDAASLLDAGQRRFIDAMLASLGLPASEVTLLSMAARRPPGGVIDEETLIRLAARMTHYLGLARPKAALILGDRTSRALLGAQWNPRAAGLPVINHPVGTMRAAALASPDLLMSRPMAKARSWQALRLLHEDLNA
ncbi:MAG TPA: hypothetical protein VNS79_14610 [Sphingobium sp.]|nr:hypothetical protein [Sphingobium sp.]